MQHSRLTILFLFLIALAFGSGYFIGATRLNQCREHNRLLFEDLTVAVKRGVILETNLNLCQEQKK